MPALPLPLLLHGMRVLQSTAVYILISLQMKIQMKIPMKSLMLLSCSHQFFTLASEWLQL